MTDVRMARINGDSTDSDGWWDGGAVYPCQVGAPVPAHAAPHAVIVAQRGPSVTYWVIWVQVDRVQDRDGRWIAAPTSDDGRVGAGTTLGAWWPADPWAQVTAWRGAWYVLAGDCWATRADALDALAGGYAGQTAARS